MRIAVVGGGMAGYAAAITAAQGGHKVCVYEKNRKPLKKLGASGNGRGNLLNRGKRVYRGGKDLAEAVFSAVPPEAVETFWEQAGVPLLEEEEGRVYPASLNAQTAVEGLRAKAEKLGVKTLCDTEVVSVEPKGKAFCLHTVKREYEEETLRKNGKAKPGALLNEKRETAEADRVILACGGAAAPQFGTDGTAYRLLTDLGHTLTELRPALCALLTRDTIPEKWAGQRLRAKLTLLSKDGKKRKSAEGEILLAKDGISGIAAMELAAWAEKDSVLKLNVLESIGGTRAKQETGGMEDAETLCYAESMLKKRGEETGASCMDELLTGAAAMPIRQMLLSAAGLDATTPCSERAIAALAKTVCGLCLPLAGTRGFDMAQITAGGIAAEEFRGDTLESLKVPGMYVCGEMLDVDGACGGFNLMFAAASGILAGKLTGKVLV